MTVIHTLIQQLAKRPPVITDGAWGTELQARGLEPGACPDEWNLTHPDRVEAVARAYVEAGSRIILTNTFGANRVRLGEANLSDKAGEINLAGARISKRAAGEKALVFGSIGPCGKMLMMGDVTEDDLAAAFTCQAVSLCEGGVDGLVIETMADLAEAKIALSAANVTGLPVVACMVFDTGGHTMMGVSPEQAARELTDAGADVIGANCGTGVADYLPICRELKAATERPIWIKANAGMPEMIAGRAAYRTSSREFAKYLPRLVEAGASFVGGCCGTTPDYIRKMRGAL